MSATNTGNFDLKKLAFSGGTPEVSVNESLVKVDVAMWPSVIDRDLSAPPSGAAEGATYIVAASPTGAWAGKAGQLAVSIGSDQWRFIVPVRGMCAWLRDELVMVRWITSSWRSTVGGSVCQRIKSSNQALTGSYALVTHDTDSDVDAGCYTMDGDGGGVALKDIGRYLVTAEACIESSAVTAANTCDLKLTLDGTDVSGGQSSANLGTSNATRATLGVNMVVTTTAANQVVRAMARRASGTSTINILSTGFRLTIRRL